MNGQNEIKIEPLYASIEQINKGFTEDSWFFITAASNEKHILFYFNPSLDPLEFKNFNEFIEANISEFNCINDSVKPHKIIKENYASISSFSGSLEEDFDEDSKKTFTVAIGKAAIMEFHKGGFSKEKISKLIDNINKDLSNIESEGAFEARESSDYDSNIYKYKKLK